jgi:hypothetical protein
MTTPHPKKYRRNLALLATVAALGLFAAGLAQARQLPADEDPPAVLTCRLDGYRYEYHVPTGTESLYEDRADAPRFVNLLAEHRATADACRHELEVRYRVAGLDLLRARYGDTIRRLHSMGYL